MSFLWDFQNLSREHPDRKVIKREPGGFLDHRLWLIYQRNCPQTCGLFLLKNIYHRLCSPTNKLINWDIFYSKMVYFLLFMPKCTKNSSNCFCPPIRVCAQALVWCSCETGGQTSWKRDNVSKNPCEKDLGKPPMHPPSGLGTAFALRLLLLLLVWGIELCSYASDQLWTCWSWTFWLVLGPVLSLWSCLAVMGLMAAYGCYVQTCSALLVWVLSDCTPGQWGHNPCFLSPLVSLTVYFYRCVFISCLSPFWILWLAITAV